MSKHTYNDYRFHDAFILRTPLLPLQVQGINREAFFKYTQQPFFIEAIYLASPVLHNELLKWHNGKLEDKKKIDRLLISLYKYYTRMQSRCTPYGLFAACGTGTWGAENNIQLQTDRKRHTRLDMNYVCALAQRLNTHKIIAPRLQFYPNNSIYTFGGQLRYVEYSYVNNKRVHQLSSVTYSDYLQLLLEKAKGGLQMHQLSHVLVDDEITYEEAKVFVSELIESQILVSELEPAVTGDEFIYQIIDTLKKINTPTDDTISSIIQWLEETQNAIQNIDKKIGNSTAAYQKIYHQLQALEAPIEEHQLFQTDVYTIAQHASLQKNIKTNLAEAITFLNTLNLVHEKEHLKKFRENFYHQYEDAEVPLLEALDTETGIGYKGKDTIGINVLLDDLTISSKASSTFNIAWNKQQELLHKKLTTALKNNQYTVHFTEEDAQKIDAFSTSLPDTFAVMFKILDTKNKLFLQNCGGSSAAGLLGRFAHGDKTIHNIINDITTHEQQLHPNTIFAEIVHLPESRIGNILLRPILRAYEIPYLGKSALPEEQQIPLQDLMVSIRHNEIILRSKKLNKEVIPRMSTAHNYSFNALPAYQFLCDMQAQRVEKPSLTFYWGALKDTYTFLPRAEYKNIVLSKAKWQLSKKDFQTLLDEENGNITRWRKQWNIPDLVVLADGDNTLLVNFKDPLSVKMLIHTIKKRNRIVLEEFLFDTEDMLITDTNKASYTNECIAILLKNQKPEITSDTFIKPIKNTAHKSNVSRHFALGSEWLYYKCYCGIKTADRLLTEAIKPLVKELSSKAFIDGFFFIRYADPDLHLRLRFHLPNTSSLGEVIGIISRYIHPFLAQGLITKIQTDTYNREIERYGANSITAAESFFHIDSFTTLHVLDAIEGEAGEKIRWQFAMRSIDELLNTFNYALPDKLFLLHHLKEGFLKEHGAQKALKQQLSAKYRSLRKEIVAILDDKFEGQNPISPLIPLLQYKAEQLSPVVQDILTLKNNHQLQVHLDDLLASFIHMLLNRLFSARQRTHEMVIYDFLYQYYRSAHAVAKKKKMQIPDKAITSNML